MDDVVGVVLEFPPVLFSRLGQLSRLSLGDLAVDVVSALLNPCFEISADGGEGLVEEGAGGRNGLFDAVRVVYLLSLYRGIVGLNQSSKLSDLHRLWRTHQPGALPQHVIQCLY